MNNEELCEEGYGYRSKEYKNYKPYAPAPKRYDWQEYHDWITQNNVKIQIVKGSCHMCDIRRTGCLANDYPRYYCKKGKSEIQTTLEVFK